MLVLYENVVFFFISRATYHKSISFFTYATYSNALLGAGLEPVYPASVLSSYFMLIELILTYLRILDDCPQD